MSNQNLPGTPLQRAYAACVLANVPAIFIGDPGVGKTAMLSQWSAAWGHHLEVLLGSIREATDFSGMPVVTEHTVMPNGDVINHPSTANTVPSFALRAAEAPKATIFFDELSTVPPSTQAGMLRVINERCAGDFQLPESVSMVAAMNPPESAVNGQELAPAMANRFAHFTWVFDSTTWLAGVLSGFENENVPSLAQLTGNPSESEQLSAASAVVGYLSHSPAKIAPGCPADPDQACGAWASPRSWDNLQKVLRFIRPSDHAALLLAIIGLVGEGEGKAFYQWVKARGLYDPEAVLTDPSIVKWTTDTPDVLFALTQAIVAVMGPTPDTPRWNAAIDVCDSAVRAGRKDVVVPAVRSLLRIKPAGASIPRHMRDELGKVVLAVA